MSRRLGILGVVVGFLALTTVIYAGYIFEWRWTGFTQYTLWDWLELLIVPAAISVVGFLLSAAQAQRESRFRPEGETVNQRVNRLTTALSEATQVIEEIDTEIRSRHQAAEKLQHDIELYNRLKELNESEVEAVAQVLGGELKKEGRRSFWVNLTVNFAFFIAGAIISLIPTLLIG